MASNHPSPADMVARFLSGHHYKETLEVFLREAGLSHDPQSAIDFGDNDSTWTIEQLLEEKVAFDHSVKFERKDDSNRKGWRTLSPSNPNIVSSVSASNVLSASVQPLKGSASGQALLVTTSERRLSALNPLTLDLLSPGSSKSFDSPILSCVSFLNGRFLAITNMAGKLLILEGDKLTVVDEIRGHGKFAVMVTAYEEQQQQSGTDGRGTLWLATAGWDARVLVYKLEYQAVEGIQLTKLSESFTYELVLPTNPECILITCDQHTGNLVLVLSRKDSSFLEYYLLNLPFEMKLDAGMIHLGRQNLAPHSSSWTPFSPAYFLISPTEPGLLAVATSSEPHMKIIIVRMLIPSLPDKSPTTALAHAPTQDTDSLPSGLARLSLLAQSREDSAIVLQCTTSAPQTPYSTPQLAWRSDGSGIWVNGDDGVVRGVDVRSGKVVAILGAEKEGHEPGSKIRCIWSGLVVRETGNVEEWVVSGGFDRKLIVWKAK